LILAAHCLKNKQESHDFGPGDISVLLGVHNYSKPQEEGRISATVSSINTHQHWNTNVQSYDGDIAILKLTNEVQFDHLIRPICLADEESEIVKAIHGTVVGFGLTEDGTLSDVAKKLDIPIRDFHNCTSHSSDHETFATARTFCGGPANGSGVCQGDSGGGVYVIHNNTFYLRGFVSSALINALNECDTKREAIFTDVTQYYDWIQRGGLMRHRSR